jgi:hypothetical protein
MVHAARLCAAALGSDQEVQPFTSRPPVQPAPLAIFVNGDDE